MKIENQPQLDSAVAKSLAALKKDFQSLYGARLAAMALFGSRARGDADEESDIDVLVVLRGEVDVCDEIERTLDSVSSVSLEYEVVISCVFVSEDDYNLKQSPLLLNIRQEAVSI